MDLLPIDDDPFVESWEYVSSNIMKVYYSLSIGFELL